jgi:hypothetical protein
MPAESSGPRQEPLLADDLPAAAAALQHGTAPRSAPIVDEFRSPVAQAWVMFLQGGLVSAGAAPDRAVKAAAEHHAVPQGGLIVASLLQAGSTWSGANTSLPRPCRPQRGRRHGSTAARSSRA